MGFGISYKSQQESGASLVEFAILAPLLMLLVFGIIEFGWKFGQLNDVRHAVREGARFAAVNGGSNDEIDSVVCDALDLVGSGITEIRVQLTQVDDDGENGVEIGETGRIRVEIDVDSLSGVPFITAFLPGTLASDVEFRLEQRPSNWSSDGSPPPQVNPAC